jgi:hypothetical protein
VKKFLVAILLSLSFVSVAFADRADEIKKYDPDSYCQYIATLFGAGVLNHNEGHPLEFKHWTPDENGRCPAESGKTDGIYVCDWDSFTDNERAFVSEHVTNGYLFASKLSAHGAARPNDQEAAVGYHAACMVAKATEYGEHRKNGIKETAFPEFVRTASSYGLTHPETAEEQMCEFQRRVAQWVIYHARRGISKDHFWATNELPEDWSDEIKTISRKIAEDAYTWPRGEQDYSDQVARDCKASQQPAVKEPIESAPAGE